MRRDSWCGIRELGDCNVTAAHTATGKSCGSVCVEKSADDPDQRSSSSSSRKEDAAKFHAFPFWAPFAESCDLSNTECRWCPRIDTSKTAISFHEYYTDGSWLTEAPSSRVNEIMQLLYNPHRSLLLRSCFSRRSRIRSRSPSDC